MPALDLEKRRIIQEGYQSGLAVAEIARLAGVCPRHVRRTAQLMQIRHPNAQVAEGAEDEIEVQEHFSPQYRNWQKARNGAAATLKSLNAGAA